MSGLFWQYAEAKRKWRHHTGKPVRALRRVLRRKGQRKGGNMHSNDIAATLQQSAFFKGKGKGNRTSGKGFGRRINPKGRDGQVLKCSICQSVYHLRCQNVRREVANEETFNQLPRPRCPNCRFHHQAIRPQAPSMTGFVSAHRCNSK